MRLEDYQKLTLNRFKGLWQSGKADTAPFDYFLDCLNIDFNKDEVRTRSGFNAAITLGYGAGNGKVRRFQNIFSTVAGSIVLILDEGGNLYTYSARTGDDATTARLTVASATDFSAIQLLGKIYIAFHNGVNGLSGVNLKVFIPHATTVASDEFRDAAGVAPSTGLAAADGAAGLVNAGDYQIAYCYLTTSGHYTVPSTAITYTAPGSKKIDLTSIDNGPSGTAGKQILITKAGLLEFFFLGSDFGGVISDNTTTTATIDFDDTTDLVESADYLYDQLTTIPAPLGLDEYKARLITYGENGNLSILRGSLPGDPESFDSIDGVRAITKDDGFVVKNTANLRDILYVHKSLGVFALQDNGDIFANWPIYPVDRSINTPPHGISEFFNVGGIRQARDWYLTIDRSGILLNNGGFVKPPITHNIVDLWQTFNFSYYHRAVLVVDEQFHKIYCAIPTGAATDNNLFLMADYNECPGLIPEANSIKWSPWEIKPGGSLKTPTTLGLVATVGDSVPLLKIGSVDGGGAIWELDSSKTQDVSTDIESFIETTLLYYNEGIVHFFTAVRMRISGSGNLELTVKGEDSILATSLFSASAINSAISSGSGLDDLTASGTFSGGASKDFVVKISALGTPDSFKWSSDGGQTFSANVAITGAAQSLSDGVSITFGATTGHTLDDNWLISALNNPVVLESSPGREILERFDFQNEKMRAKFRLPAGSFILNKIEFFGDSVYSMRPM